MGKTKLIAHQSVKSPENKIAQQKKTEQSPSESTIKDKIKEQIEAIDTTRRTRIHFSKRLSNYSRRWRFIFFVINIEAVIFVLLSLTNTIETIKVGPMNVSFNLVSGIFTIYVILLQYYISVLNYNERARQVHYHQLEIQDLKLQLEMLFVKTNAPEIKMTDKMMVEQFQQIINQYQLALKNNENHRMIDYDRTMFRKAMSDYRKGKSSEKPKGKEKKDLTIDMLLIGANMTLTVIMFFVLLYVVLF